MTTAEIEKRLISVEQDIAELKSRIAIPAGIANYWIERVAGTFLNSQDKAAFDHAMRHGRPWRNAQGPKSRNPCN